MNPEALSPSQAYELLSDIRILDRLERVYGYSAFSINPAGVDSEACLLCFDAIEALNIQNNKVSAYPLETHLVVLDILEQQLNQASSSLVLFENDPDLKDVLEIWLNNGIYQYSNQYERILEYPLSAHLALLADLMVQTEEAFNAFSSYPVAVNEAIFQELNNRLNREQKIVDQIQDMYLY